MTAREKHAAAVYRLNFGRLGKWPARPAGSAQMQLPPSEAERADRRAAIAALPKP